VDLTQGLLFFFAVVPAIVFHEVAHGYVSFLLGDPTAKNAGRLTLNPLKHVDPFGTLLMPALLILSHLPAFGYAKPVPINPYFYKNHRQGLLITGLAGPSTNLVFGTVAGLLFRVLAPILASGGSVGDLVASYLFILAEVNFVLMFFNLIPIPPFDGSRVLPIFLSDSAMRVYSQVERYGFIIIFAVLFLAPGVLSGYFAATVDPLLRLVTGIG
jgi:Zn-dependent protease